MHAINARNIQKQRQCYINKQCNIITHQYFRLSIINLRLIIKTSDIAMRFFP